MYFMKDLIENRGKRRTLKILENIKNNNYISQGEYNL